MKNNFIHKVVLAAVLGVVSVSAMEQRDCGGDYRYQGQAPVGARHNDVERAGVLLCKDFGHDDQVPNDRYAIILGHDKNLNVWLPSAGKVEKTHIYTTDTAKAELCEETGGLIDYTSRQIMDLPYVYSGSKQLFFLINPRDPNISVRAITNSCISAQSNPNLAACYKEIDEATAVSVVELLDVAQQINNGTLGRQNSYTLHKRTQRSAIEIDGFYMRIFSNRLNETKVIFNQMFGHQF